VFFMIQCTDKPDSVELRQQTLPAHKTYLEGQLNSLVWAGARQRDDGKTVYGSFYLLRVPNRRTAEMFVENEPFYRAGLFEKVELSNVRQGIYQPALAKNQE